MTAATLVSRRIFLADLGRGAFALTVVGLAGCAAPAGGTTDGPSASTADNSARPEPSGAASPAAESAGASAATTGDLAWERVDLGFVSAYVLVRGGEAAVVDTGVAGSEGSIADALTRVGLDWGAVGHVILTHMHADHAGSVAAVMDAAADAVGYAGAEDLPAISAPRPLTAVADGDTVFGLRIVATPGHTAGHVAVLDETAGILVAGDALGTTGGVLAGSNPQFTADTDAAVASVAKLGALVFETLLVGHGEPILSGASEQVAALARG